MKFLQWTLVLLSFVFYPFVLPAQPEPDPVEWNEPGDSETKITDNWTETPIDGIVEKEIIHHKPTLAYGSVRESDILWEKCIWRIIDVREKMNLPFVFPEAPLFEILRKAAASGEMPVFSTENDKFTVRLSTNELNKALYRKDTIIVLNPITYEEEVKVVQNDIDWEDIKRFRLKEIWYFDSRTSTLKVRIIGIAPVIDVRDDEGNFRFEKPLFWVYYPYVRELLARQRVFTPGGNINSAISWEDLFEMRMFSSTIYKESNIYDRKLEHYLSGTDLLMAAGNINFSIFNLEDDMWQK